MPEEHSPAKNTSGHLRPGAATPHIFENVEQISVSLGIIWE